MSGTTFRTFYVSRLLNTDGIRSNLNNDVYIFHLLSEDGSSSTKLRTRFSRPTRIFFFAYINDTREQKITLCKT